MFHVNMEKKLTEEIMNENMGYLQKSNNVWKALIRPLLHCEIKEISAAELILFYKFINVRRE